MNYIHVPEYAQGSCGVTHVDRGLLEYFWNAQKMRSFLDVGCGPGGQVIAASEIGYRALGLEVDIRLYRQPLVALCDLCVEPVLLPRPADLVWSVEVAEHVPDGCLDNYFATLIQNTGYALVMTASQMMGALVAVVAVVAVVVVVVAIAVAVAVIASEAKQSRMSAKSKTSRSPPRIPDRFRNAPHLPRLIEPAPADPGPFGRVPSAGA